LPQRLLQAGDIVVDPAKVADMPVPVGIPDAVTDHSLTGLTIDLLGTGIDHQGVEFLCRRGVIDRDVLETMPDVPMRQGDDLGLSSLVDLGDRFEQRLGVQDSVDPEFSD